jgi:hypothetical protein
LGLLTIIGLAVLTNCTSGTDEKVEQVGYNASNSADSLCLVNPSWFPHSQTPAPEEGQGSPFDTSSTTNQIFHQWSWNKFLWLTKPDAGGNPLFLNQAKVKQVTSHMGPISVPSGTTVVLQDTAQAGSGAVLLTNPDYNNGAGTMVYYSIHMNLTMYNAGLNFAAMIKNNQLPKTNDATFPVGSFEMKVAWVPVTAIPASKRSQYYTTMASLSANNGVSFNNTEVALIGMHVVGVVQNHPEFIWATFEHDDLSPDYDWTANSANSATDQLLYKKGSTTGINGIVYDSAARHGITANKIFDLFKYGIPRNPDGSFMNTSQDGEADFQNVDGINQCVKSQLQAENDVWANYFYNGSLWLNTDGKTPLQQAQLINSLGPNIGSATPGSYARGSVNCANVTMETFTQTFQNTQSEINVNNLANCFSCHNAQAFPDTNHYSPIYLSHSFFDYLKDQETHSFKKTEALKAKSEQRLKKIMLLK